MQDLRSAVSSSLPESPSPVEPLDYAPPPSPRPGRRDTWWGVGISLCLSMGVGWLVFGWMMMNGARDDDAGPIAVGAAFIALALGLAGTVFLTRRFPSS